MSIGHGSGVIDKAWLDTLIADIEAKTTLDDSFNVPLAGGISKDARTIYIDTSIPTMMDKIDITKYLRVHEFVEKTLLDAGFSYLPAHGAATAVELAAVQDDGVDVNKYDAFWSKWEKVAARHRLGDGTPPDLETKPYEES